MNNTITAVSLFTGAGGMDIGFERAGAKIIFANEMMSEAAQTYNANHPVGVMVNDDIYNQLDSKRLTTRRLPISIKFPHNKL